MAVNETRMLILGAVALFEPVNGYQIRRELLSWHVEHWAHTNPGSIYHGLATLAKQEYLVRSDVVDGGREVAVYQITDAGRAELERLLAEALERPDPVDRAGFSVAFSLLPLLPTERALESLTRRRVSLEQTVAELAAGPTSHAPPHANRAQVLWLDLAIAELGWLRETIEQVRAGALDIDLEWAPPPDDPGWQMDEDRRRYRELLGH